MKHPNANVEALLQKLVSPALATIDLSLERITKLLATLKNPEDKLPPVVHVAGTNGKGSLLAYLTAILQAAGYRVHRYISPHLVCFNERIMLAGEDIDDGRLLDALTRVDAATLHQPVTFFEATTAAAFLAFSETPADIVLLETGLGGRLDATNTIHAPKLTAIAPISMDHIEYLGNSIALIAAEKAAIIKRGIPCVTGPQAPEALKVIEQAGKVMAAPLFRHGVEWSVQKERSGFRYRSLTRDTIFPMPVLHGAHQLANAGAAIACVEQLKAYTITDGHIAQGLTSTTWPARLQRLASGNLAAMLPEGAELWLDGGHNPAAGVVLAAWAVAQTKPVHLICGMLATKDTKRFLEPLADKISSFTAIGVKNEPLSQTPEKIGAFAHEAGIPNITICTQDIKDALEHIVKNEQKEFIILICGSLYLAGNILWQNSKAP